jgi:hypothetical protein
VNVLKQIVNLCLGTPAQLIGDVSTVITFADPAAHLWWLKQNRQLLV